MSEVLGPVALTARGFEIVEFSDSNGARCSLQASSRAEHDKPGTSAVWLGPSDADARILARNAAAFGVETTERVGWVPYPIPDDVLLTTRMHLSREQVAALIHHLQSWLENDSFASTAPPGVAQLETDLAKFGSEADKCETCGGTGVITDPKHPMHPSRTGDAEGEDWCLDCNPEGQAFTSTTRSE